MCGPDSGARLQTKGDVIMSGWGGAVADIGGGVLGSALQYVGSRDLQRRAYSNTKEMMRSKYQWATEDLRKAGINPMMAALGGQSIGASSAPSIGMPDIKPAESAKRHKILAAEARERKAMADIAVDQAEMSSIDRSIKQITYDELWKLAKDNPWLWTALTVGEYGQEVAATAKDVGIGAGAATAGVGSALNAVMNMIPTQGISKFFSDLMKGKGKTKGWIHK